MIDTIALSNFKAFRVMELEIAPLTLLSGWNSAGKSSLLQSLAALRQSAESGVLERGLLLNGDYVQLGAGRDVLHEDYSGVAGEPTITIEVSEDRSSRLYEFRYDAESDLLPLIRTEGAGNENWLRGGDFQFLRADRQGPAVFYARSYRAVELERRLGTRGEHAVNYLRIHQDDPVETARYDPSGKAESGRLLDQVSAWLQHLSPGVNVDTEAIENADVVALTYGYYGRAGLSASNRYRATNVGFGLSYVLPVVIAALSASPGTTLLVENPEAHLHPRGQSALAHLLSLAAGSGVQILVESHSDHFLNGIRRAVKGAVLTPAATALHFFDRGSEGEVVVESPEIRPNGAMSQWPPGFFDEWDRAITDLLT